MSNNDYDDYEVGYKKPPKKNRFKKGQSGNPKGRPKKKPKFKPFEIIDAKEPFLRICNKRITTTIDGHETELTLIDAIYWKIAQQALAGDRTSQKLMFNNSITLSKEQEKEHTDYLITCKEGQEALKESYGVHWKKFTEIIWVQYYKDSGMSFDSFVIGFLPNEMASQRFWYAFNKYLQENDIE